MKYYDPLKPPDPEEWRSIDEQEQIRLVEDFHRRARIPNAKAHAVIHVVVENQIALGDEIPVRRTVQRLMSEVSTGMSPFTPWAPFSSAI